MSTNRVLWAIEYFNKVKNRWEIFGDVSLNVNRNRDSMVVKIDLMKSGSYLNVKFRVMKFVPDWT